jgi:hypothetical protein
MAEDAEAATRPVDAENVKLDIKAAWRKPSGFERLFLKVR